MALPRRLAEATREQGRLAGPLQPSTVARTNATVADADNRGTNSPRPILHFRLMRAGNVKSHSEENALCLPPYGASASECASCGARP